MAHLPEHLANMHQIQRKDGLSHQRRRDARKVSIEEQLSLTGPSPRVTEPKNKKVVSIVIINAFIDWLPTMKGKKTTKKSAKQHGAQALKVWRGLTTQEEAEETPLNLEDIKSEFFLEYVEHQRLQMKPVTLPSYLCSFVYFFEFLDSSSCDKKDLNKEQLEVLIKETKNYNRNLRDDVAQRKTEFALQEHEELLPASAVSDYLNSYHLDTMETTTFKGEVFDGILTYCGIRDALMAMLVCTNGHRTSAIRDIRHSNVYQAKDENGMKVFGVSSHKTSASRGVANFSLTPKQFLVMKEFAIQQCKLERPCTELVIDQCLLLMPEMI